MVSKWWVACAALLTLLAGCIDDAPGADPDPDPVNDGDDDHASDGNQTAPPTNETAPNAAPTATLEASASNGTAPLNVTFTLGGSDPDGDNLTWSLTVGNDTWDGDVLPATINATLEAGNHTATLTVSDGDLTGDTSVTIVVQAPAVEEADDGVCHADPSEYEEIPPVGGAILYLADTSWIYEETNGIPGLQWSSEPSLLGENHAKGAGCLDGDTIIF